MKIQEVLSSFEGINFTPNVLRPAFQSPEISLRSLSITPDNPRNIKTRATAIPELFRSE